MGKEWGLYLVLHVEWKTLLSVLLMVHHGAQDT